MEDLIKQIENAVDKLRSNEVSNKTLIFIAPNGMKEIMLKEGWVEDINGEYYLEPKYRFLPVKVLFNEDMIIGGDKELLEEVKE